MPARCGSCGKPPRSYWKWRLKDQYRCNCQHCGTEVAQRHGRAVDLSFAAVLLLAMVAAIYVLDTASEFVLALAVMYPVYALVQYVAWQKLPWDPAQPDAPPAPPPTI